jgi:hypothetical protein
VKVNVYAYYSNCSITEVELPEGKTWDDVDYSHVKWGTLYITWRGSETPEEFPLSDEEVEGDHKRPDSITVFDEDHVEILYED